MKNSLKKLCSNCNTEQIIWKNFEGKKFCKSCWNRCAQNPSSAKKPIQKSKSFKSSDDRSMSKVKKIRRTSVKRAKEDRAYIILRKKFLLSSSHLTCEIHIPNICTHIPTDVHHTHSGEDREKYYLDTSTWLATCRQCHDYVHSMNSDNAKELGYLKD